MFDSVETIQLILRSMPGVAHTTGSDINKEIHFSLDHIANCASRAKDEINGVLVHEVVHCYQYNGQGTAPGGLIEGVAGTSFFRCISRVLNHNDDNNDTNYNKQPPYTSHRLRPPPILPLPPTLATPRHTNRSLGPRLRPHSLLPLPPRIHLRPRPRRPPQPHPPFRPLSGKRILERVDREEGGQVVEEVL